MLLQKHPQVTIAKKRIVKTVVYRTSATCIAQTLSWIIFKRIEVNITVAVADVIQTFWYYIFESFWK